MSGKTPPPQRTKPPDPCVLCDKAAVTTAAQIPVCQGHYEEYAAEAEHYLNYRPFYLKLQRANQARLNPSPQRRIYKAILARDYEGNWTTDEEAGRHVLKLIEEMGELAEAVAVPGSINYWPWHKLRIAANRARLLYDHGDKRDWAGLLVDRDTLRKELADCAVVLFSLAEVVGVDLVQAALAKAEADVERGVRP